MYNPFIPIDQKNVDKIPWIEEFYQYYFQEGGTPKIGILYGISSETYSKLVNRLQGASTLQISTKDKVFIMPGCKIPIFKLKDHFKKQGATLTTDINKATFFIGNNSIQNTLYSRDQAKGTDLLFTSYEPEIVIDQTELNKLVPFPLETSSYKAVASTIPNKYKSIYLSGYMFNTLQSWTKIEFQKYFITPAGLMILFNSIAKKIPIANEDTILDQIKGTIVITEEVYKSIVSMITSTDINNRDVVREILSNCEIKDSLIYIWRIATKYEYIINSKKMKNLKLFIERARWKDLARMSAAEFITYLYNHDHLTKEWYGLLIKEAAKEYSSVLKSSAFKMTLTPSDQYSEFADESDVFEFHHPDEVKKEILPEPIDGQVLMTVN